MNEKRFNLLDLQKEKLTSEEMKEIYNNPKNPETEFEGVDEDEKEIVPKLTIEEKEEIESTKRTDKSTERKYATNKDIELNLKEIKIEEEIESIQPFLKELENIDAFNVSKLNNSLEKINKVFDKMRINRNIKDDLLKEKIIETKLKLLEYKKIIEIRLKSSSGAKKRNDEFKFKKKENIETEVKKEISEEEKNINDYLINCKNNEILLRINNDGNQTFKIIGSDAKISKGSTVELKNTETGESTMASINKEFLYEINNVVASREDLVNLKKAIERDRSLFEDSGINSRSIEGTIDDLFENNKNAEEIDISNNSAIIRALEIVEDNKRITEKKVLKIDKEHIDNVFPSIIRTLSESVETENVIRDIESDIKEYKMFLEILQEGSFDNSFKNEKDRNDFINKLKKLINLMLSILEMKKVKDRDEIILKIDEINKLKSELKNIIETLNTNKILEDAKRSILISPEGGVEESYKLNKEEKYYKLDDIEFNEIKLFFKEGEGKVHMWERAVNSLFWKINKDFESIGCLDGSVIGFDVEKESDDSVNVLIFANDREYNIKVEFDFNKKSIHVVGAEASDEEGEKAPTEEQPEILQEPESEEPETEGDMPKDVPNAEDFKIKLGKEDEETSDIKSEKKVEEIRGVEVKEAPEIKSEEEIEKMGLEALDEEIKKISKYLKKIEEKAKSMGVEDIRKTFAYQEFDDYLDDLKNAKKIKEEAEEEVPEEEPVADEAKEPEKFELNEARKGSLRNTNEIEMLMEKNKGIFSIPWEDLTDEQREIRERIKELERGRVLYEGSAIFTDHVRSLEKEVGTPQKEGILGARERCDDSFKLLNATKMLEIGWRMNMQESKKKRRLFPSVGKFGKAAGKAIGKTVGGRLNDPFKKKEKKEKVETISKTNERFKKENRKDLNSMSEEDLTNEFVKVLEDLYNLDHNFDKKTKKIIQNARDLNIENLFYNIMVGDETNREHIESDIKEFIRRIGKFPNYLNNPREYLSAILSKVDNIYKEKIGDGGRETPGDASENPSDSEILQNAENEEKRKEKSLEDLKNKIKKDLEELEKEDLTELEGFIFSAKFAGKIEDNTSVKKLIDEYDSILREHSSIENVLCWVEKYKNNNETENIKIKDIEEIINDIKRSRA